VCERQEVCVFACAFVRIASCLSVCVCVREKGTERQRECKCVKGMCVCVLVRV